MTKSIIYVHVWRRATVIDAYVLPNIFFAAAVHLTKSQLHKGDTRTFAVNVDDLLKVIMALY